MAKIASFFTHLIVIMCLCVAHGGEIRKGDMLLSVKARAPNALCEKISNASLKIFGEKFTKELVSPFFRKLCSKEYCLSDVDNIGRYLVCHVRQDDDKNYKNCKSVEKYTKNVQHKSSLEVIGDIFVANTSSDKFKSELRNSAECVREMGRWTLCSYGKNFAMDDELISAIITDIQTELDDDFILFDLIPLGTRTGNMCRFCEKTAIFDGKSTLDQMEIDENCTCENMQIALNCDGDSMSVAYRLKMDEENPLAEYLNSFIGDETTLDGIIPAERAAAIVNLCWNIKKENVAIICASVDELCAYVSEYAKSFGATENVNFDANMFARKHLGSGGNGANTIANAINLFMRHSTGDFCHVLTKSMGYCAFIKTREDAFSGKPFVDDLIELVTSFPKLKIVNIGNYCGFEIYKLIYEEHSPNSNHFFAISNDLCIIAANVESELSVNELVDLYEERAKFGSTKLDSGTTMFGGIDIAAILSLCCGFEEFDGISARAEICEHVRNDVAETCLRIENSELKKIVDTFCTEDSFSEKNLSLFLMWMWGVIDKLTCETMESKLL